jgi:hypothetical protein
VYPQIFREGLAIDVATTATQLLPVFTTGLFVPVAQLPLFTSDRLGGLALSLSTPLDGAQRGTFTGPQAGGCLCAVQPRCDGGVRPRPGRHVAIVDLALRVGPAEDRAGLRHWMDEGEAQAQYRQVYVSAVFH